MNRSGNDYSGCYNQLDFTEDVDFGLVELMSSRYVKKACYVLLLFTILVI